MPSVHLNPAAATWQFTPSDPLSNSSHLVLPFHRSLPFYAETPLRSFPALASSLGLGQVLVKDESARFDLPAFKILGASWAIYRLVLSRLGLDISAGQYPTDLPDAAGLGEALRRQGRGGLKVVTCTMGNWGRAVAKMGKHIGVDVVVYVPSVLPESTRELIRGEGAEVVVIQGGYEESQAAVIHRSKEDQSNNILFLDTSWEGYSTIPQWSVQGYQTMLLESDAQIPLATNGLAATHAIIPVGSGGVAQAVTQHYKSPSRDAPTKVIAVEPSTAACLMASLSNSNPDKNGEAVAIENVGDSIMCGMNCGTLSTTAWPILRDGVDASVVISDLDAHNATKELKEHGVDAGPCGAATLAALKVVCTTEREKLGLDENSVVVLYSTEGPRGYVVPTN